MTQTLVVVVLFVAAMAAMPWVVRRVQQRQTAMGAQSGAVSRVLSAVAVGPQQRVVTVEVGPEHARRWLVLGVTAQQINCLHVLDASGSVALAVAPTFAQEVAAASASAEKAAHG